MNVYEVTYEERTQMKKKVVKKWGRLEWSNAEPIHVLANGDAEKAIEKAKKHILSQKLCEFEGDYGEPMVQRIVGFRLIGVERICSIDAH